MRQLFINNWQAPLLAPAAIGATTFSIDAALAAKLPGLGVTGFYELTALARDAKGQEVAWEIVKATQNAAGQLTVERAQGGTQEALWPAGTILQARVTAEFIASLVARLEALEAVPNPGGDDVVVTMAVVLADDDGQYGYNVFAPFGSCTPDTIQLSGAAPAQLTNLTISSAELLAEFGDPAFPGDRLVKVEIEGVGVLLAADGTFNHDDVASWWTWSVSTHDWESLGERTVTWTFSVP